MDTDETRSTTGRLLLFHQGPHQRGNKILFGRATKRVWGQSPSGSSGDTPIGVLLVFYSVVGDSSYLPIHLGY